MEKPHDFVIKFKVMLVAQVEGAFLATIGASGKVPAV
jgi:hypothetical protein